MKSKEKQLFSLCQKFVIEGICELIGYFKYPEEES